MIMTNEDSADTVNQISTSAPAMPSPHAPNRANAPAPDPIPSRAAISFGHAAPAAI
ncbi:hypothetical protein ACQR50_14900 [Sphingomonas sp. Xoc002]|uniref:hypothetical protein n=1 Tax=Sphingomonas sp. Xoc002 TaxID=2837624 RepID=UPI003D1672C8